MEELFEVILLFFEKLLLELGEFFKEVFEIMILNLEVIEIIILKQEELLGLFLIIILLLLMEIIEKII